MDDSTFETLLAAERPRLVRLCAWFSGSQEAAEDLTQETLIAAWKSRGQLNVPEKLKAWTSAIARNVCLNWSRQQHRQQAFLAPVGDRSEDLFGEGLPGDLSPEIDSDRQELANLLDQALAMLPAETAQMLVEHYIQQTPHAEIAAKYGLNTGTVGVRIQRGKLSLQKLMQTTLNGEAQVFGLAAAESTHWQETNIWCPGCGKHHLMGQYSFGEGTGQFALRCPACHPEPDAIMAGLDLSIPQHARLLDGVKAFKPAYNRLKTFTANFFRRVLELHETVCPICGGEVAVQITHDRAGKELPDRITRLSAFCSRCNWATNSNLTGLVMALPEGQQFWRENPRMRTLPQEVVESQGVLALVTRLQSISGTAQLAVVSRRDTLETLGIYKNDHF